MNQTQSLRKMKNRIAVYLGIVTLILVPLCIKGSYFGLIELKARAFLYAAVPTVLLAAVLAAAGIFFDGDRRKNSVRKSAILLLIISLWSLFSSFMSISPELSLTGS